MAQRAQKMTYADSELEIVSKEIGEEEGGTGGRETDATSNPEKRVGLPEGSTCHRKVS